MRLRSNTWGEVVIRSIMWEAVSLFYKFAQHRIPTYNILVRLRREQGIHATRAENNERSLLDCPHSYLKRGPKRQGQAFFGAQLGSESKLHLRFVR